MKVHKISKWINKYCSPDEYGIKYNIPYIEECVYNVNDLIYWLSKFNILFETDVNMYLDENKILYINRHPKNDIIFTCIKSKKGLWTSPQGILINKYTTLKNIESQTMNITYTRNNKKIYLRNYINKNLI